MKNKIDVFIKESQEAIFHHALPAVLAANSKDL